MNGTEATCRCFEKVGVERADSPSGTTWEDVLARVHSLSRREVETFRLLAGGASNRLIAATLRVKERTVKAHVAQILAKLDLESRLQAGIVAFACAALAENADDIVLPCPPVKVRVMALHPPADLPDGVPLKVRGSVNGVLVGLSRHGRGGLAPMTSS
jgi:DNA-binding CsgD family transcriptional regulator